jgi:hypothetical protein
MVFRLNGLSLDSEGPLVQFISLRCEVYNGCFIYLKSYTAPFLPVKCFINNYFNTFLITLHSWSGHLRGKIIYEHNYASLAINLLLYEVYIKEEE